MGRRRAGVTLAELVVCIGIIGAVSFLVPILLRLFNTLAYLQQKSLLAKDAKAVLWLMSHEMSSAVKVDLPGYTPNTNVPGDDCVQSPHYTATSGIVDENYNCMRIWVYDFDRFSDNGRFELPDMYALDTFQPADRFGRIIYEVIQETSVSGDLNGNGKIDPKPYLLRTVKWKTAIPGRPANYMTRQTFLMGRLVKSTSPTMFLDLNAQQIIKITLQLRSSFDRPSDPPKFFAAVLTMESEPLSW